jgi:hypothetical protein
MVYTNPKTALIAKSALGERTRLLRRVLLFNGLKVYSTGGCENRSRSRSSTRRMAPSRW